MCVRFFFFSFFGRFIKETFVYSEIKERNLDVDDQVLSRDMR